MISKGALFFSSIVMTLKSVAETIWADKLYLLGATIGSFILIVFSFFFLFVFIHEFHRANFIHYKDKRIFGAQNYIPAFKISENLQDLRVKEAQNELYLTDWGGTLINSWMPFSQDRSLQRQIPSEAESWDEFRDTMIRGKTPQEMVDKTFEKYGATRFRIRTYHDNSIERILPRKFIQEYFELDAQGIEDKVAQLISSDANNLFAELVRASGKIRKEIFENREEQSLLGLKQTLFDASSSIEKFCDQKERAKNIFYGEVLNILGSYQAPMDYDFSKLVFVPTHFDLFYLSIMNSTSNPPSDIIGVTKMARVLCWIQLTISYFLLAFTVAVLLKVFKIE
ncbi:MAG: hypothetical protein AABZ31_05115 [Bdellovibrionota bacterium]